MNDAALSTLPRDAKGPLARPPLVDSVIGRVAEAVAAWLDVGQTSR